MIIALYGRINAGKDTAADLLFVALTYWKAGVSRRDAMNQTNVQNIPGMFGSEHERNQFHELLMTSNETLHNVFERILLTSFSARIHELTAVLTGLPLWQILDRNNKDTLVPRGFNKTIRQIMIDVGEGLRASYGPDVWVGPVTNFIEDNQKNIIIITGMRHPNEYAALEKMRSSVFVKVTSDFEIVKGAESAEGLLEGHNFHFVWVNQKDNLRFLWEQVVDMVYSLGKNIHNDYANY